MRGWMWPAAAILGTVVYFSPTKAAVTEDTFLLRTTGDLVDLCAAAPADPMGTAALNFCHGFGIGAYRVLAEVERARSAHMFCVPTPAPTRNEALASFVQWAKANPGQMGMTPEDGIAAFLSKQYPCAKRR